jgi:hypothetical protein
MKKYGGSGGVAPLILNVFDSWRRVVNIALQMLYPRDRTGVPMESEVERVPEAVWRF